MDDEPELTQGFRGLVLFWRPAPGDGTGKPLAPAGHVHTRPQTVAYLAASDRIGGGNHVVMLMITGIDPRRFRPILIAPREGKITEWATAHGVPWTAIPIDAVGGRLAFLRVTVALIRLFVRERVRLVHALGPFCYRAASLAARLTGAKRLCHLQFHIAAQDLTWHLRFGVDTIVTCYERLAAELSHSLRARSLLSVEALPNPVDAERFTPTPVNAVRSEHWRAGADHLVVIVGHISDVKGYPTFLRAAAQIRQTLPRVRFLAVGGETLQAGYGREMRALADALDLGEAVEFLGWRDDVPDILRAADVMVLPSRAEGLPLAVLEAMACGTPVVATDVNGTPEAVVDGETGFLIRPDDPALLSERILTLLRDPGMCVRFGAAARRRVEERFTRERFLQQLQAIYLRVLGR